LEASLPTPDLLHPPLNKPARLLFSCELVETELAPLDVRSMREEGESVCVEVEVDIGRGEYADGGDAEELEAVVAEVEGF
jgi:hypothetical protein